MVLLVLSARWHWRGHDHTAEDEAQRLLHGVDGGDDARPGLLTRGHDLSRGQQEPEVASVAKLQAIRVLGVSGIIDPVAAATRSHVWEQGEH